MPMYDTFDGASDQRTLNGFYCGEFLESCPSLELSLADTTMTCDVDLLEQHKNFVDGHLMDGCLQHLSIEAC